MQLLRALLQRIHSGENNFEPASNSDKDVDDFQRVANRLLEAKSRNLIHDVKIMKESRGRRVIFKVAIVIGGLTFQGEQFIAAPESPTTDSPTHAPDALTGLASRGAFDEALATLAATAATATPLALVFADVDKFKSINDQHGHAKGDEVLQEVAHRLQAVCRGKGDLFRYGGEEVVLLLPNFDLAEALAVAERCRRAIADRPCATLAVTASFGVSTFPGLASAPNVLCETADKAMYDAKNRGRNLVRYHGEPEPRQGEESTQPVRKSPEPGGLTEKQLAEFRSQHFKRRALVCPQDGAYMRTFESEPLGAPVVVFVDCPQCGLNFQC
jgi:diguanylate cyclase (GGDEF)-like protein